MSYLTPNMNLNGISIGQDSGLTIEQNTNINTGILDSHSHVPGSGIPIQPNGLNINSDLTIQNNNLTNINSTLFTSLSSPLMAAQYINCLYVVNGNLYFNDGLGDAAIQLTAGGAVNASSSGISRTISGVTATASFDGSANLVVYSNTASTIPANIFAQSILLGNSSGSTDYVTVQAPASTPTYSLTLPLVPISTSFLTVDTSGNIVGSIPTAAGITGGNIAAGTITGTNLAANSVTSTQIAANAVIAGKIALAATDDTTIYVNGSGQLALVPVNTTRGSDFSASNTAFVYPVTAPGHTSATGIVKITLLPRADGAASFLGLGQTTSGNTTTVTLTLFVNSTPEGKYQYSITNPTVSTLNVAYGVGQTWVVSVTPGTAFGYNVEMIIAGAGASSSIAGCLFIEDII